jgi:DNA-3-methyladenine glycosylase
MTTLARDFYERPVLEVARDLLGCIVVHDGTAGTIVETEAYHESEPACHAFVGLTERTRVLFGEPGVAYVYRSYGIHALLNAVCEPPGVGAAVLIRALAPLAGVERMRSRRGRHDLRELCSGPGKLTQAMGIELSENATSLLDGPVRILEPREAVRETRVVHGSRIGITRAAELPWRFCLEGSPHLSRPLTRSG